MVNQNLNGNQFFKLNQIFDRKQKLTAKLTTRFISLATSCLLLCFSSTSLKGQQSNEQSKSDNEFKMVDSDGNGELTRNELQVLWIKNFSEYTRRLDANKDGTVSKAEYTKRRKVFNAILDENSAAANLAADDPAPKQKEFTEIYDERFIKKDPKIGTTISNLVAFDEKGDKLDFDDLRGKYTVINFGCLT